mgnify:CR=1 FL=1
MLHQIGAGVLGPVFRAYQPAPGRLVAGFDVTDELVTMIGNIHGGCINVDKLQRDGSTYFATGEPDFLTANDAWFMPVVQKTGPDGCLYILDWYDRYHCYQDANRDPAGIDRLKGRLYRVRYKDSPRAPQNLDLAKETDEHINVGGSWHTDMTFLRRPPLGIGAKPNQFERLADAALHLVARQAAAPSASSSGCWH